MNASFIRQSHPLRAMLCATLVTLLVLLMFPLAGDRAQAAPGDVALVSSDAAWAQANNASYEPAISADGRYVAFQSQATNLVSPATSLKQIFRKDLVTGEVRLVSASAAGDEGNSGLSESPSISADGRYVAFGSDSTNLVSPATGGYQVFRKDLVTGEVKLVSANAAGVQGEFGGGSASISADGRYVAFDSPSTNLVSPATSLNQIFRKDLVTGEVKLCSANAAGIQGNDGGGGTSSIAPSISSDGRYVAFDSYSTNLVSPATSGEHVFHKDLVTGEVKLCSSDAAGVQGTAVARVHPSRPTAGTWPSIPRPPTWSPPQPA